MDLTAQFCGRSAKFKLLASKLERLGVVIRHTDEAHRLLYSTYHNNYQTFHAIAACDFIVSDGKVNTETALPLLYAILKNKPIISLAKPSFSRSVDSFTVHTIRTCMPHIHINNLAELNDAELQLFVAGAIEQFSYELPKRTTTLIRSRVRTYFKALEQQIY